MTEEERQAYIDEVFGSSSDDSNGDGGSSNDDEDAEASVSGLSNDFFRPEFTPESSEEEELTAAVSPPTYGKYAPNANWRFFLNTLSAASAKVYEDRIADFFQWWGAKHYLWRGSMNEAVLAYFNFKRAEKLRSESLRYAGSVFNGWYAMFHKFYQMCGFGLLLTELPALGMACKSWLKKHRTKKSKTFSKGTRFLFFLFSIF